jgi:hypothetical protein
MRVRSSFLPHLRPSENCRNDLQSKEVGAHGGVHGAYSPVVAPAYYPPPEDDRNGIFCQAPRIRKSRLEDIESSASFGKHQMPSFFEDDAGRFWRYLHAYRKAWPVIVGK